MNSDVLIFNRLFRFVPGIRYLVRAAAAFDEWCLSWGTQRALVFKSLALPRSLVTSSRVDVIANRLIAKTHKVYLAPVPADLKKSQNLPRASNEPSGSKISKGQVETRKKELSPGYCLSFDLANADKIGTLAR